MKTGFLTYTLMTLTATMIACGCDSTVRSGSSDDSGVFGYTTDSPYRKNVRSVFVPIWKVGREVYRRQVEYRLTEALKKQILMTDYKISDKPRADTELTGTIERIDQRVLSFNPDSGDPRETEVTIVVSFTWTDLRTGEVLAERKNFSVADKYFPEKPLNEDFFQGSEQAINNLANRIVEQMERW
ncbi:MAG: hypothetical protein HZA50_18800 [Planctomycetes bacterium]|nr:hypothetical protein [Planctomycetota bacterium]